MLPTQYFRPNMDSGWGTWIIRLLTGIDAFPWSPGNIPLYQTHLHTTGWNCCCMEKKSPCLAISWEGLVFRCYPNSINNEHLQTHFPGHKIPALGRSTVLPQLHRGFFSTLYLWFPTGHEAKIQMDSITWKQPWYTVIPLVVVPLLYGREMWN